MQCKAVKQTVPADLESSHCYLLTQAHSLILAHFQKNGKLWISYKHFSILSDLDAISNASASILIMILETL